jgi:streptogramin lyase
VVSFVRCTYLLVLLLVLGATGHGQSAHFTGALGTLPIGGLTDPYGMAVDGSGNVFVADNATNSIIEFNPGYFAPQFAFLTGDGSPYGIAVDGSGNLYISDNYANEVVKETLQPGGYYTKSLLPLSGLSSPEGVAVDAHGNVYIADFINNRVVKATPSGNSYIQSTVPTSALSLPKGVAVDGSGNLYIVDTDHLRVLKETLSGTGYSESVVANLASFSPERPIGIAADGAGDVFVLEYLDDEYFAVVKETLSGGVYIQSSVPSYGQNPYGIAADSAGDVYIASPGGGRLLRELAGPTTNFGPIVLGSPDTADAAITLNFTFDTQSTLGSPAVVTLGTTGLDFTNGGAGTCGKKSSKFVYNPGDSCSVAVVFNPQVSGSRLGAVVLRDPSGNTIATAYVSASGVAPQVSFLPGTQMTVSSGLNHPSGVAVDANGDVFVAESASGNVYKETASGSGWSRTTIASGLDHPTGLALDGAGNVYVATSSTVYKETLSGGAYVQSGIATDLSGLLGVAVDRGGNLYLTSSGVGDVHKETLQADGGYTETAIGFGISSPRGVAVDGSGDIFILNASGNHLYAETLQANGSYLQAPFALGLADPESIAVDGNGNLYIADPTHGEIDKVTPQANGSYVEITVTSGLNEPSGLAVDGPGNLYFSQGTSFGQLDMIDLADPPALSFAATAVGATSPEQYVRVWNAGNAVLNFPVPASGTNASISAGFTLGGDSTCPAIGVSGAAVNLNPGSSCYYGISFAPQTSGPTSGGLLLMDSNLNVAGRTYAEQDIPLSGTSQ